MGISFIKSTQEKAGQLIAQRINDCLNSGQKIAWLVPGGSNIKISVEILASLTGVSQDNLRVLLTDERYAKFGHPDSNFVQLKNAGFKPPEGVFVETLMPANLSFEETVDTYEIALAGAFSWADQIIGQFGMGSDGHTAGILPNSPATKDGDKLVYGYKAADYQRITMSFKAIKMVKVAYVCTFGQSKEKALDELQNQNLLLDVQPAQIFKLLPETYIISDIVGESQ